MKKLLGAALILVLAAAMPTPAMAENKGVLPLTNASVSGSITDTNEEDQYTVVLDSSGRLSVTLNPSVGVNIALLDGNGNTVAWGVTVGPPSPYTEYKDLNAGTYYLRIKRFLNTGTYTVAGAFTPSASSSPSPAPSSSPSPSAGPSESEAAPSPSASASTPPPPSAASPSEQASQTPVPPAHTPSSNPKLPQTGLLFWPIPLLLVFGGLAVVLGLILVRRKKGT